MRHQEADTQCLIRQDETRLLDFIHWLRLDEIADIFVVLQIQWSSAQCRHMNVVSTTTVVVKV